MTSNASVMDFMNEIRSVLILMKKQQDTMAKQIAAMYNDDYDEPEPPVEQTDNVTQVTDPWDQPSDEFIKEHGIRVAYNKIDNPTDVQRFKEFIFRAKTNFRSLTTEELKWVDVADKDFDDIRLSRKHLGLLQDIYSKINNGKQWPFQVKPGYMHKLGDRTLGQEEHITWSWFE